MTILIKINTPNGSRTIRAVHNVIQECLIELYKKGQLNILDDNEKLELKTQWGDICSVEIE